MTINGNCVTCRHWQYFAELLSHDGKQFLVGHCGQWRGLTADEYVCDKYWDDRLPAEEPASSYKVEK